MKPSVALRDHRDAVRRIVVANRGTNARVFGSVATGDDADGSDLDILVDTTAETTLFDLGSMRAELEELLGVPVDIVTPGALTARIRSTVMAQARPI